VDDRRGARIRHRHPLIPARLLATDSADTTVEFDDDGPAVTPGQAAVFYRGDAVLGGGWIAEALTERAAQQQ
jgi:tRNA-specific 2-thiouridylase